MLKYEDEIVFKLNFRYGIPLSFKTTLSVVKYLPTLHVDTSVDGYVL